MKTNEKIIVSFQVFMICALAGIISAALYVTIHDKSEKSREKWEESCKAEGYFVLKESRQWICTDHDRSIVDVWYLP